MTLCSHKSLYKLKTTSVSMNEQEVVWTYYRAVNWLGEQSVCHLHHGFLFLPAVNVGFFKAL